MNQHPAEQEIDRIVEEHLGPQPETVQEILMAIEDPRTNRQKVYDFLDLPGYVQENRAKKLGLYLSTDQMIDGSDLFVAWIKRAKEKGCLRQLLLERQSGE